MLCTVSPPISRLTTGVLTFGGLLIFEELRQQFTKPSNGAHGFAARVVSIQTPQPPTNAKGKTKQLGLFNYNLRFLNSTSVLGTDTPFTLSRISEIVLS